MQAEEKPSKTERKRAMHELQALGERLVGLNPEQLAAIALPEDLHDAVVQARRITKHEARRRQLQYIGRLMRAVDPEPIREKLRAWDGVSTDETARVHRIERWREELLEDDGAIGALVRAHPGIDTQRLRALTRNAREERSAGRPPRAYRELFRALRDIIADSQPVPENDGE
ncbi:MAG TPA: ribosome biogenesis factor YjgA [Burkholderiales bacterium]|nr:ribosome biogenesis factor YjgA [Burkholderiales bacterium]